MDVNSAIEEVGDIGDVADVESEDEEGRIVKRATVGEIDGVLSAEDYLGCICCNVKVKTNYKVVGESVLKMRRCVKKIMAKVVIIG